MSTHTVVFQATTNLGWYLVMHTTNTKPFFSLPQVAGEGADHHRCVPIARVYHGVLEFSQGDGTAQYIEAALIASLRG